MLEEHPWEVGCCYVLTMRQLMPFFTQSLMDGFTSSSVCVHEYCSLSTSKNCCSFHCIFSAESKTNLDSSTWFIFIYLFYFFIISYLSKKIITIVDISPRNIWWHCLLLCFRSTDVKVWVETLPVHPMIIHPQLTLHSIQTSDKWCCATELNYRQSVPERFPGRQHWVSWCPAHSTPGCSKWHSNTTASHSAKKLKLIPAALPQNLGWVTVTWVSANVLLSELGLASPPVPSSTGSTSHCVSPDPPPVWHHRSGLLNQMIKQYSNLLSDGTCYNHKTSAVESTISAVCWWQPLNTC